MSFPEVCAFDNLLNNESRKRVLDFVELKNLSERNKKITYFCHTKQNKPTDWWWPYVKFTLNNKPSVSVKRPRRDVTECAVIHVDKI